MPAIQRGASVLFSAMTPSSNKKNPYFVRKDSLKRGANIRG
jgi:hypothetical protein